MSTSKFGFQEVLQLVELIKGSASFSELRIRSGDLEIDLRRGAAGASPTGGPAANAASLGAESAPVRAAEPSPAPPSPARPTVVSAGAGTVVVTAPMVGTVYRAPEPGAAPFVTVGQEVEPGDQLCIIEIMKLMNAVCAESRGTVIEILFGDGDAVEFGQELLVISAR